MKFFLIIDDHEIVRKALKLLINDFFSQSRIHEAANGEEAADQLKRQAYDLVVLDLQIPKTNSLELLEYITARYSSTKVLVFSMASETIYGKRVIKAGAHGFLSKEASMDEVRKALETVINGRKYLSEKLVDSLIDDVGGEKDSNPFAKLSAREVQIAACLLEGLSVSEISYQVHLQPSTVGTYKARIFDKLNISNLLDLKELSIIYNFPK